MIELILYTTDDGRSQIKLRAEQQTVWLTQLEMARGYWGESFTVFLTGGDAELVCEIVPEARVVPDLVFVGLAMACPLS